MLKPCARAGRRAGGAPRSAPTRVGQASGALAGPQREHCRCRGVLEVLCPRPRLAGAQDSWALGDALGGQDSGPVLVGTRILGGVDRGGESGEETQTRTSIHAMD